MATARFADKQGFACPLDTCFHRQMSTAKRAASLAQGPGEPANRSA
jgi:hypothetical protein